jgi:hypothetical protein
VACHLDDEQGHDAFTLSLPGQDCIDCHRADDPHSDAYAGTTCGQCHVTEDFALATFDHALVLDGPDSQSCTSCHSGDDPHAGQFAGRDCADCHVPETFTVEDLNHDATAFPLDGAHAPTPCAACHPTESGPPPIVRYRPIGTDCIDCHQEATP